MSVLVHEVLGAQLLMVELERSDLDVCVCVMLAGRALLTKKSKKIVRFM